MLEKVAWFLFLCLLATGLWLLVFNKKLRRNVSGQKPIWWLSGLYKDEKEGQELNDAVVMTMAVFVALIVTLITLGMLVAAIVSFF
ncbi:MAG: hypothetical protein M3430_22315 [Acidobacteriota bacterium]|nr:hypothetical protein [Acidobacteriota bacterium]